VTRGARCTSIERSPRRTFRLAVVASDSACLGMFRGPIFLQGRDELDARWIATRHFLSCYASLLWLDPQSSRCEVDRHIVAPDTVILTGDERPLLTRMPCLWALATVSPSRKNSASDRAIRYRYHSQNGYEYTKMIYRREYPDGRLEYLFSPDAILEGLTIGIDTMPVVPPVLYEITEDGFA
jgi:hypothetical protein